jgi:Tol biopolymer transport system component
MPASTLLRSGAVLIAALATAPAAHAWPGLNGYIGYGSNRATGSAFSDDVFVTPTDAETPTQLTTRRADDGQPAFSPDGRRIAFKTTQFGSNQLAVMNADGSDEHLLTRTFRFSEGQPAWSPDGTQLLYRRTPENPLVQNADIWRLDIAGSIPDPTAPLTQAVLEREGDERYPSYSPDGSKIVFRSGDLIDANGDEELYVMNADGTDVTQLTSNADFDTAPAWSPDGTQIAFERAPADTLDPGPGKPEPEEKDIYVMNADGSDVRRLTDSPGKDEGPTWSPDGTKIAFSSDRDGQQEIYVMDADGGNPRRLTVDPGRDESPDWQTLPFDTRGHRACGDVSLAPGGASSIVVTAVPCVAARAVARVWTRLADDARVPPAVVARMPCTVGDEVYDLAVVHCTLGPIDLGFVWRRPAAAGT